MTFLLFDSAERRTNPRSLAFGCGLLPTPAETLAAARARHEAAIIDPYVSHEAYMQTIRDEIVAEKALAMAAMES